MIKFLTTFNSDTAAITSLSAASAHAAANVQTAFPKQTWRSTGLSNEWLKFDMSLATSINFVSFFANNLTNAATVKVYAHASDLGDTEAAWAGASYSATITSFDTRAALYVPAASQSYQWWLLTFTDAGNSAGYIEVGKVAIGSSTSPTDNISENLTENLMDPSEQNATLGAMIYTTERQAYKTFDFEFVDITTADQAYLRNIYNTVGKKTPIVISFDSDIEPVNLTAYGVFTSDLSFSFSPNNRANTSLSFRELR